ncbi:MAG: hypothetical protein WKF66_17155 [Pedobacter sp.]
MNKKTLFEITLKIVGLFALWTFLQSLGGILSTFSIIAMFISNGGFENIFMGFVAINMLFDSIVPGVVAFCCLFKTGRIVSILKLDAGGEDKVALNPRLVYNVIVLVAALAIFMHGCANCITYSYNRETNTSINMVNGEANNVTSLNQKETRNVNYFAFAEIIMGLMILLKSTELTNWLLQRYEDNF